MQQTVLGTLLTKFDQRMTKKQTKRVIKSIGSPTYHPTPSGLSKWMVNTNDILCEYSICL